MLTPSEARALRHSDRTAVGGAWIRVVEVRGFGGMEAGESVVLAGDGTTLGRLLRGVLDMDLPGLAYHLTYGTREAFTVGLSVTDERAMDAGFVCGGHVELLAQRLATVPSALWRAVEEGRPATVVTVCGGEAAGATAVVDDTGRHGDRRLAALAVDEMLAHQAGVVGARACRRMVRAAGRSILLDVILPRMQLVVVGGGELSRALCAQGNLLGWAVDSVDDRDRALDALDRLGPSDALIVLTHVPDVDTPVLAKALRRGVGFVGALGSRQTQAYRTARLRAEAVPEELVANIHGPAGLDLGASSPAETSVAVVAEVLLNRSARSGLPLRDTTGRINT
jgi:xanthine dehydrogenase accessory factor